MSLHVKIADLVNISTEVGRLGQIMAVEPTKENIKAYDQARERQFDTIAIIKNKLEKL